MHMNKDYGITTFIMDSGERYCLIIDRLSCTSSNLI